MKKIGFIGFGNMGQAMARGLIQYGSVSPDEISAYAPHGDKLVQNCKLLGITPKLSAPELVKDSQIVIMACKPYQIEEVIQNVGRLLGEKIIVSVAAGWDYDKYKTISPAETKIQCIMPNTPVCVGKGVIVAEEKTNICTEEKKELFDMFEKIAKVIILPSRLMDAASAVSGCGPAFIDMVIEAIGDGGVKNGIPREKAYEMVCQTMIGAAQLKMESGLHPGQLKDQVCSPGGTTIKGVAALEKQGVRYAFISAIDACVKNE